MGIGNYLMGDEGIGIHVIQSLQEEHFPPSVQLLDGGVGSYKQKERIKKQRKQKKRQK